MAISRVYQQIAQDLSSRGVGVVFTLMGDANMHLVVALAETGIEVVHVRHEHAAVVMAEGCARHSRRVAVASVTCGPGLTQTGTALMAASRRGVPLVILAGDTPVSNRDHNQRFDQRPFVESLGAIFVDGEQQPVEAVAGSFTQASERSVPVVVRLPMDIQQGPAYLPTTTDSRSRPSVLSAAPKPNDAALADEVRQVVDLVAASRQPLVLAGQGVILAGCEAEVRELAERTGALLATTLEAKGIFEGHERNIGIAGGFSSEETRCRVLALADLVIAVGARLDPHTTDAGRLFAGASIVVIDAAADVVGGSHDRVVLRLQADAADALERMLALVPVGEASQRWADDSWREVQNSEREPGVDAEAADHGLDPRTVFLEFDELIPPDFSIVVGVGHFASFAATHLRGRPGTRFHFNFDFGAIGQALPQALGIAALRGDGRVLLVEGDGSMLMHVQELETARRHGLKLAVAVINDAAYGAEVHKLAADGLDPSHAQFGDTDLAAIAAGFGVEATRVDRRGQLKELFDGYLHDPQLQVWDVRIDGRVRSERYRRLLG